MTLTDHARALVAEAASGEQVEVYLVESRTVEVEVRDERVESFCAATDTGASVRVVTDGREGLAWAAHPAELPGALTAARANAAASEPDPTLGLPDPGDCSGPAVELDLWCDDVPGTPVEDKVALALALERATLGADPRIRGAEKVAYRDAATRTVLCTSTGVVVEDRRTACSVTTVAMAEDGDGTQTGWGLCARRRVADLDVAAAATEATTRALRLLGAAPVRSRRTTVVFDPLVTRSLLALVGAALCGDAVQRGRSIFTDRLGEEVAAGTVTLVEDPTLTEAWGAATHDGEGVPTRRVPLIDGGRLETFLHNVTSARRAGARTTGSAARPLHAPPGVAARALHLTGGRRRLEEIVASVDDAFYVQAVTGLHSGVNVVSGDLSLGAVGCLVRGGALARPVREVTIASTLPRLLRSVREVGADLRWLPGGAAGCTLVVDDVTLSGT